MADNLCALPIGTRDGNQTLMDKRNRQLWVNDIGHWGVYEIVGNKYSIILECRNREEVARFVFEHYPGH